MDGLRWTEIHPQDQYIELTPLPGVLTNSRGSLTSTIVKKYTPFFTIAESKIHRLLVDLPSTDLVANSQAVFGFTVVDKDKVNVYLYLFSIFSPFPNRSFPEID